MKLKLNRRLRDMNALFIKDDYVDAKVLYAMLFDSIPCITKISDLNSTRALVYLKDRYAHEMMGKYNNGYFDYEESKVMFHNIILVLCNKRLIYIGHNYIHVLHTIHQSDEINELLKKLAEFRLLTKEEREIIEFRRTDLN